MPELEDLGRLAQEPSALCLHEHFEISLDVRGEREVEAGAPAFARVVFQLGREVGALKDLDPHILQQVWRSVDNFHSGQVQHRLSGYDVFGRLDAGGIIRGDAPEVALHAPMRPPQCLIENDELSLTRHGQAAIVLHSLLVIQIQRLCHKIIMGRGG